MDGEVGECTLLSEYKCKEGTGRWDSRQGVGVDVEPGKVDGSVAGLVGGEVAGKGAVAGLVSWLST